MPCYMYAAALNITVKFETSVKPTALLNLDIEYQNADLWGLWGGGANAPRAPPCLRAWVYPREAKRSAFFTQGEKRGFFYA